jgi:hypothetical protein
MALGGQETLWPGDYDQFTDAHRKWVAPFLEDGDCVREGKLTQSIAVGTQRFISIFFENHKAIYFGTDSGLCVFSANG